MSPTMNTTSSIARRVVVRGNGGMHASSRSYVGARRTTATTTSSSSSSSYSSFQPPPSGVGTVLTFLSPGPARSASAIEFLGELFRLPRIRIAPPTTTTKTGGDGGGGGRGRDVLDELHFGSSTSMSSTTSWDSTACACPESGTILHFLSLSCSSSSTTEEDESADIEVDDASPSPLRLIAMHGSHHYSNGLVPSSSSSEVDVDPDARRRDALIECRRRLAKAFRDGRGAHLPTARARGLLTHALGRIAGGRPDPRWIVSTTADPSASSPVLLDLTPIFPHRASSVTSSSDGSTTERHRRAGIHSPPSDRVGGGRLRELVLPFVAGGGGSSIQTILSKSSLTRPLPGLYQCSFGQDFAVAEDTTKRMRSTANRGLVLRPLPAAREDLRLSPPSLVFQCESLEGARELVEGKLGGRTSKIGWRGHGQLGSLIVSHPSVTGLEIRISEAAADGWVMSSSFDESQESLLAGSVAELQSAHVTSEGKSDGIDTTSVEGDAKSGKGDCWVEFRSNVTRPAGFVNSLLKKSPGITVAKPPDLPYD